MAGNANSGRSRTPTAKLRLAGSRRVSGRDGEPEPDVGTPDAPPYLSVAGRAHWDRLVPIMEQTPGLLTVQDGDALASLCESIVLYEKACELIEREGLTMVTDKGNHVQHPAVGIRNKAWDQVYRGLANFGLSPSDRARVSIAKPEGKSGRNYLASPG